MKWIFLSAGLMCLAACAPDAQMLNGSWRMAGYYQEGQTVPAAADSVGLVFHPDQRYEFRSTGFYRERGAFRTSGSYLFLLDSTASGAQERALRILYLSEDSLKLEMRGDSLEKVVFFVRSR